MSGIVSSPSSQLWHHFSVTMLALVLLLSACRGPQPGGPQATPAHPAETTSVGDEAPVQEGASAGDESHAPEVTIDVRITRVSLAWLHTDAEAMLAAALSEATRQCPALAFRVTDAGTNYAIEHFVYEASHYWLIFVQTPHRTGGYELNDAGFFFRVWPTDDSRPMRGATLMLGRAETVGSDVDTVRALVDAAVQQGVTELAAVHGVRCGAATE